MPVCIRGLYVYDCVACAECLFILEWCLVCVIQVNRKHNMKIDRLKPEMNALTSVQPIHCNEGTVIFGGMYKR